MSYTPFKMKGRPMVDGSGEHKSALKAFWNKKKKKEKTANELVEDRTELREKGDKLEQRKAEGKKTLFGNLRRKRNAKKQIKNQKQINAELEVNDFSGNKKSTTPKAKSTPKSKVSPNATPKQIKNKTVRTKNEKYDLVNWVKGNEGLIPDMYGKTTKQSVKDTVKKGGRAAFKPFNIIGKGIDYVNRKLSHDQND
jgi:hypothetical protein